MQTQLNSIALAGLILAGLLLSSAPAAEQRPQQEPEGALPAWFEENRVQAHFENAIPEDLAGLYRELHPAIRSMGARVLTRIFKTVGEGAWWPTAAGSTHESLGGRDLGREIAVDAHANGLKAIAYYRIMCDDFVEKEHPEWLCRDAAGKLVLEPRTRRRPNPQDRKHVICFNSPARELIKTRLLELADRGVDGIYFDSWHMPEVCTCGNCRAAYQRQTGQAMSVTADRGSDDYRRIAAFVAQSIVRNFREWKQAVAAKHPDVIFAIGSSLYPCFDTQMQIGPELLHISDTSKTEFAKPFGGFLGGLADTGIEGKIRGRPFIDASYALPSYDLQNALGWSFTRDSCDGRPPLMWIPFTKSEQEAMFSAAAAVSYGCIASIHPTGIWTRPRKGGQAQGIRTSALDIYKSSYALGEKVSPWLATARPLRFALIHVSHRSRDARIADPRALWVEFFAPVLGVFETLKEAHLPVATINDLQLDCGVPPETRLVVLPYADEITESQRSSLSRFEAAGGTILRMATGVGWHLKPEKPKLKRELIERIAGRPAPPIQARGPAAMHAVFFRGQDARRTVACLVNDFGWFRSERCESEKPGSEKAPPPCSGVVLEIAAEHAPVRRALDALTGKELPLRHENGTTTVMVPDFAVMACVVVE